MAYKMKEKNISAVPNMRFGILSLAFIFLFNANINVIDIIPDIIGYCIIVFALFRLADLNEDIAESQKYFKYMIEVELAKLIAILWAFGLSQSDERETGILLISFVFAVIDSILLFIAFNKLFSGLISLGYRHENSAVLGSKKKNEKNYTDKIRRFTLFFIIFKPLMALLPEFSNLTSYEYDETSSLISLYDYIGLLRTMSFIVVSIVGIFWLFAIMKYFSRVRRDELYCKSLEREYVKSVIPRKGIFIKRNLSMVFFVLSTAAFFMIDFKLDCVNIIPDFIGAIYFLIGFCIAFKNLSINKSFFKIFAGLYILTSLLASIFEFRFFSRYSYVAIYRNEDVYNLYITMTAFSALNIILFAVVAFLLIKLLSSAIETHTGFVYGTNEGKDTHRISEFHKESKLKLIWVAVSAGILTVADIINTFFGKNFDASGFLMTLAGILFFCSVIKVTRDISDDIEIKYMLE